MFNKKVNALEKKITELEIELKTAIETLQKSLASQEDLLRKTDKRSSELCSLVSFMNEHPQGYNLRKASHLVTGSFCDYLEFQWIYRNKLYTKTICELDGDETYSVEKDEKLPIFHIFVIYEKEGTPFQMQLILDELTNALVRVSNNEI